MDSILKTEAVEMKRFLAFLSMLLLFMSLLGGCAEKPVAVADPVPEDFQGLVLQAPADMSVFLYTGFKDGEVVPPAKTYEAEGVSYLCFPGLSGNFRYKASGAGCYAVTQNLAISEEESLRKTVVKVEAEKKAGTGWESTEFEMYSNKVLADALRSDPEMWPEYAALFSTPYYTQEHAAHQTTTQAQMEAFLQQLDDPEDQLYLYSTGKSSVYQQDIPMAIFTETDLSGADSLEAAAAAMGQDKPTVLYRAQMHGNEPAAGEAALAIIGWLDASLGAELLQNVNICVIPRQSPDGAQDQKRLVMGGIDPNRDSMRLETAEIRSFLKVCQLLEPEMIIDGHEYKATTGSKSLAGGDIMLGLGYTPDNSDAFRQLNLELSEKIFAAHGEKGLDYRFYSNCVNSVNSNLSRCYASQQGTMFILVESRGIGNGLSMYTRRIVSHLSAVEVLLRFAAEDAQRLQQTVDAERQMIVREGGVYDSTKQIFLDLTTAEDLSLMHPGRKLDQQTGAATDIQEIPKVYTVVNRQRTAPTAYVIPAEKWDAIGKLIDLHGIEYRFIPAGSTVRLQQYSEAEQDLLTEESAVTFPEGAYVLCKNQVRGITLSMLMEPDVDDLAEQKGTLVQQGLLRAEEGRYPIYRYIRDLNAEGFIDYQ